MLYAIIGRDGKDSLDKRPLNRPKHLQRLQQLQEEGRLVLAGPMPAIDSPNPGPAGYVGSLIVAEFESLELARHWADTDPYWTEGVFVNVEVHPFRLTLPA